MGRTVLALTFVALLALVRPGFLAGDYHEARKADLVVVLNSQPANPMGGELWLMDLSGRLLSRLTQNLYHEEHPRFSPDGRKIAFVRNLAPAIPGEAIDLSQNEIFIFDLDRKTEARLTNNTAEDGHPEWSYDGRTLLFHSRRNHPQGKATLWVMGADGANPRPLSSLLAGDLGHTHPVWAPGDQWIAFASHREEKGRNYSRIEKIFRDGSARTVVSSGGPYGAEGAGAEPLGDLEARYSPDGAVIWSSRRLPGNRLRLFSFSAGSYYPGKAETDMGWKADPTGEERTPRFSPDGARLLMTRSSLNTGRLRRQVAMTDSQSSFRRYVTSRPDWDLWDPDWHPLADSGARREMASAVVTHAAQDLEAWKSGAVAATSASPSHDGDGATKAVTLTGLRTAATASPAVYEVRWKLGVPVERVISLGLRLEAAAPRSQSLSLVLELMDWREGAWVTVFHCPPPPRETVEIFHEFSPAHFINPMTPAVLLRLKAFPEHMADGAGLKLKRLNLEVRELK